MHGTVILWCIHGCQGVVTHAGCLCRLPSSSAVIGPAGGERDTPPRLGAGRKLRQPTHAHIEPRGVLTLLVFTALLALGVHGHGQQASAAEHESWRGLEK